MRDYSSRANLRVKVLKLPRKRNLPQWAHFLPSTLADQDAHGKDASECEIIEVQVMIRYC